MPVEILSIDVADDWKVLDDDERHVAEGGEENPSDWNVDAIRS